LRNSIGLTKINSSQFIGTFFGLFMVGFFGAVFVFGWVYYLQGYPNEGSMFTGFVDCSFFCGSKFNGDVDW
jgi:ABC-2 type transport system permease protein